MSNSTPAEATATRKKRNMLVFDSAYTYDLIVARDIAALVTGRDLGGYFDHIWTCHPVASLLKPEDSPHRFGGCESHSLAPGHTFIEGRIGRFAWLARLPRLNLALAQFDLLVYLLRLVAREKICIVRAEDGMYNGLFAWAVSRVFRLPLMIGIWGNPGAVRRQTGKPLMPRLFRDFATEERVERFVLARADRVIVQNEDNRQFVVSAGVPRSRTEIFRISNVLHKAHFEDPRQRTGGTEALAEVGVRGGPTLLTISRLQELKLVHHVLYAVKTLKDRGRNVTAVLVGEGPFRPDLEELADNLGIREQVVFCGDREQTWVAKVIPAVSVVVSPLTGRALGEAALGGAPIVAYDIDWHSELVQTGSTGELVPHLDHQALADAIGRMLDDPDRARALGANVRSRAMQMLDPALADQVQINAYESLLSGLPARA